jgi:hypothetical protein
MLIDHIGYDILAYLIMLFQEPASMIEGYFDRKNDAPNRSAYNAAFEAVREAQSELDGITKSETVLRSLGMFDTAVEKAQAQVAAAKDAEQALREDLEVTIRSKSQESAVVWIHQYLSEHSDPNHELDKVPLHIRRQLITMVIERIELRATEKWSKKDRTVLLVPTQWQCKCWTPYKSEFTTDEDCIVSVSKTHYLTAKKERGETARNTYPCDCGCGAEVSIVPSKDKSVRHFASNECYQKWRDANKKPRRRSST